MVQWTSGQDGAFACRCGLTSGELRKPYSTDPKWLIRNGDLRVVLDSEHENMSLKSQSGIQPGQQVDGSQWQTLVAWRQGVWNGHSKIDRVRREERRMGVGHGRGGGPECAIRTSSWFNSLTGQVFSIDEGDWGKTNEAGPNEVWRLDVASSSWDRVGRVNPIMDLFVLGRRQVDRPRRLFRVARDSQVGDCEEESDRQTVFTTSWNWSDRQRGHSRAKRAGHAHDCGSRKSIPILSLNDEGEEAVWLDWDVASAFVEAWGRVGGCFAMDRAFESGNDHRDKEPLRMHKPSILVAIVGCLWC